MTFFLDGPPPPARSADKVPSKAPVAAPVSGARQAPEPSGLTGIPVATPKPSAAAERNRVVLTNGDAIVDSLPAIEAYMREKGITDMQYMRMHPTMMAKVGKGKAGALLDDRLYREWPEVTR